MPDKGRYPTEVLKSAISRFTEDIESLHTTLPLLMRLTGILRTDTKKKYDSFMEKSATVVKKTEDVTKYSLEPDSVSRFKRLKHQHDNFRHAYRLIPRHFVISLVAQYDSFLGQIIRFLFSVKPDLLNASGKALPFTELVRFPDIEAARAYIIEKEIESIIRKCHADQFAWLKEKLKTPFNKDLSCWPTFIELTERRNLFVHTDGTVSSQYLAVCAQHKATTIDGVNVGDQLEVPNDYFQEAYRCIFEIGVKMAHVIWRRLCPDQIDASDSNVIDITFDLIEKREYELAIRLLSFFTRKTISHASDSNRRVMLINLAQAYKWKELPEDCANTLALVDWSACDDKFKIAIATLKDNFYAVCEIMKRLKHDSDFHAAFYRDWPLFRKLRKQDSFLTTFEECYGKPFTEQQTTTDDKTAEQDESTVSPEGTPSEEL